MYRIIHRTVTTALGSRLQTQKTVVIVTWGEIFSTISLWSGRCLLRLTPSLALWDVRGGGKYCAPVKFKCIDGCVRCSILPRYPAKRKHLIPGWSQRRGNPFPISISVARSELELETQKRAAKHFPDFFSSGFIGQGWLKGRSFKRTRKYSRGLVFFWRGSNIWMQ